MKELNEGDRSEEFIRLLAEHERRLTAYVMTFVPRAADADDILQETKLGLWQSFDQFVAGTNFGAWARQAAFNRILDFRRRKGRESQHLMFSDSCIENLAVAFERKEGLIDARIGRLTACVAKLSSEQRLIVSLRYHDAKSVDEIAESMSRSVAATYRVLSRIRLALRDCILEIGSDSRLQSEPIQ